MLGMKKTARTENYQHYLLTLNECESLRFALKIDGEQDGKSIDFFNWVESTGAKFYKDFTHEQKMRMIRSNVDYHYSY